MATPIYVNPASTNDTGDGTTPTAGTGGTSAKKTIDAALNAVDDNGQVILVAGDYSDTTQGATWQIDFDSGVNINVELIANEGATIALAPTHALPIYVAGSGPDGKKLTFTNLTLTCNTANRLLQQEGANIMSFVGCIISDIPAEKTNEIDYCAGTDTPGIERFINCTVTAYNDLLRFVNVRDRVEIIGCNITVGRTLWTWDGQGVTDIIIKNSDINGSGITAASLLTLGYEYNSSIPAIADWSNAVDYTVGQYAAEAGDVYQCLVDNGPGGVGAIVPGSGTNWRLYWVRPTLGHAVVTGNDIAFDAVEANHAILIGWGFDSVTVANNKVQNGDRQIVVKNLGSHILNNICLGAHPINLFSGGRHSIVNNTCVASSGTAMLLDDQESQYTVSNEIINNIFVADGAGTKALFVLDATTAPTNTFDYNCYWAQNGAVLATIGGVQCDTLAEIQARWTALGRPDNDANSIVADPQLDADYKPTNPDVVNGGRPDSSGNKTSMGGIPTKTVSPEIRARYSTNIV